jgi:hypothetical protein
MKPQILFLLFIIFCAPLLAQVRLVGFSEYGEANQANSGGSIFEVNADGSDYQVIKNFEGSQLEGTHKIFNESDGNLYGFASNSNSLDTHKYLFKKSKINSDFQILKKVSPNLTFPMQGKDGFLYYCDQTVDVTHFVKISLDGEFQDTIITMTGNCTAFIKCTNEKLACVFRNISNQTKIISFNTDGTDVQIVWNQDILTNESINENGLQVDTLGYLYWLTTTLSTNPESCHIYKSRLDGSEFEVKLEKSSVYQGYLPTFLVKRKGEIIIMLKDPFYYYYDVYEVKDSNQLEILGYIYTELNFKPYLIQTSDDRLFSIQAHHNQFYCQQITHLFEYPMLVDSIPSNGFNDYSRLTLVADDSGGFYGCKNLPYGSQVVKILHWEIDSSRETILFEFSKSPFEGTKPTKLIKGIDGNYYGILNKGGEYGFGHIFKIAANGSNYEPIYAFGNPSDGNFGLQDFIQGSNGKLYGLSGNEVISMNNDGTDYKVISTYGTNYSNIIEGFDGKLYWFYLGKVWKIDLNGDSITQFANLLQNNSGMTLTKLPDGGFLGNLIFPGNNNFDPIFRIIYLSNQGVVTVIFTSNSDPKQFVVNNNLVYCDYGIFNLTDFSLTNYDLSNCNLFDFQPQFKASDDLIYSNGSYNDNSSSFYSINLNVQNCDIHNFSPQSIGFNNQLAFERPIPISTQTPQKENNFTLFPVPCSDFLNVSCPIDFQKTNWKITDITGKTLLNGIENGNFEVSTIGLPSGIYFFTAKDEDGLKNIKSKIFTKI